MTRRVGILGGTFDPIHVGHLDLASAAERALALTSVVVIPAHVPPHKPRPEASSFHRFAMASLALDGHPTWQVSDIELLEASRSYTTETLDRLHRDGFRPEELFFLMGADAFRDIESWKDYPAILEKANFAVVARPGHPLRELEATIPVVAARMSPSHAGPTRVDLIDAPTLDVSATAIRERLTRGEPIDGLVPRLVQQHIERHGLYAAAAPDRRSGRRSLSLPAGRLHDQS